MKSEDWVTPLKDTLTENNYIILFIYAQTEHVKGLGRIVFAVKHIGTRKISAAGLGKQVALGYGTPFVPVAMVSTKAMLATALSHAGFLRNPTHLFGPEHGDEIRLASFDNQQEALNLARLTTDYMAIPPYQRMIRAYTSQMSEQERQLVGTRLAKRGFTVNLSKVDELPWTTRSNCLTHVSVLFQARSEELLREMLEILHHDRRFVSMQYSFTLDTHTNACLGNVLMQLGPEGTMQGYQFPELCTQFVGLMIKNTSVMSIVPLDLDIPRNPLALAILASIDPEISNERDKLYARVFQPPQPQARVTMMTVDSLIADVGALVCPGTQEAESAFDELTMRLPMWLSYPDRSSHDQIEIAYYRNTPRFLESNIMLEFYISHVKNARGLADQLYYMSRSVANILKGEPPLVDIKFELEECFLTCNNGSKVAKFFSTYQPDVIIPVSGVKRALENVKPDPCPMQFPGLIASLHEDNLLRKLYEDLFRSYNLLSAMAPYSVHSFYECPRPLSTQFFWEHMDWSAAITLFGSLKRSFAQALETCKLIVLPWPSPLGDPTSPRDLTQDTAPLFPEPADLTPPGVAPLPTPTLSYLTPPGVAPPLPEPTAPTLPELTPPGVAPSLPDPTSPSDY
jgi:hypothetical protein